MKTKIHNIDDLRAEILRLRIQRSGLENDLKTETRRLTAMFRVPAMLLGKLNDWFSPFGLAKNNGQGKEDEHDWVTSIFRVGLPVMMNKFVFPQSGFLMKSLVEMISQKAAKTINKDVMSDLIEKFTDWVKSPKQKRRKQTEPDDYGIPPDSETY